MKSLRTLFIILAFTIACKPLAETKAVETAQETRVPEVTIPPTVSLARRTPIVVVAHNVLPSVVNIQTEATIRRREADPYFDPFGFFGGRDHSYTSQSLGSGFVWSNDGVIVSPSGNAVLIEGYNTNGTYNGAFTNTGSIVGRDIGINLAGAQLTGGIINNGGMISGNSAAISTFNATGATTITNKGGGLIIGDLRLANNFADTFIGENGGIEGNIVGNGTTNDDRVLVQNGTQYFIGKASNLTNFDVNNGGFAVMGARFEGDTAPFADRTKLWVTFELKL